ncbi:Death on curing protein Doc toxin [Geitlerinema sp. FC II]|nr:Death on curing protein Doc toxin [Geitlerinema sp. FC II]
MNHPFVDENKRVAYLAMEAFSILNGLEVSASVDDAEQMFLNLARGQIERETLANWLRERVVKFQGL